MKLSLDFRAVAVLALGLGGLAGCGADMDELDSYINEVKARPGGRIEPLPEITPYAVFTYTADVDGTRSPFAPDTPQAARNADSMRPDENRVKEPWALRTDA